MGNDACVIVFAARTEFTLRVMTGMHVLGTSRYRYITVCTTDTFGLAGRRGEGSRSMGSIEYLRRYKDPNR